jgi:predicted DNA-binding antitoxin AbrB/MazE fold protein
MSVTMRAVYEKGVLVPKEPLDLPEGAEVVLEIRVVQGPFEGPPVDADDPTGWKAMRQIIGMWKDAPKGVPLAREHDRYLRSGDLEGDGQGSD